MKRTFENPIIRGFYPDPSICHDGCGNYYLVTSSFEFFPGVPLFHSRDLVNWKQIGHCLTRDSQLDLRGARPSGGIYAPTIRYHRGRFYMVTTNVSNGGNFFVYTDDPTKEWSDPIFVAQGGIDASLYFEKEDVYFCSTCPLDGKEGIVLSKIHPETGEIIGTPHHICSGSGGRFPEAPHLFQIGEFYYLLMAEGGTEYGHSVTLFRSRSIDGPYEGCPQNPILSHVRFGGNPIQAVGHADLVCTKEGKWFLVCLGIRPLGPMLHPLGRETFLAPLVFRDGWFFVDSPDHCLHPNMQADLIAPQQRENFFQDPLSGPVLQKDWIGIRNVLPERIRPDAEGLFLVGTGKPFWEEENPAFLGIRQPDFVTEAEVDIEANGDACGGICVYAGPENHYDLEWHEGHLWFRKTVYDTVQTVDCGVWGGTLHLMIRSDREFYRFFAERDNGMVLLGQGATAAMCTEVTRYVSFTGTLFGLYCSKGEICARNFRMSTERNPEQ